MQKSRLTGGALVMLPVMVASSFVLLALSGCGGASTSGFIPLPETQQQQLGGVVTTLNQITGSFNTANQYNGQQGGIQQSNCPQVNTISAGVIELDYGTGCQPPQGGPTISGKITIAQSPTGSTFEVIYTDYNAGNGFVVNGNIVYNLDPNTGTYTVLMNLSQTPASGTLQACSVQFQFNGTYTPNNNGYTLNGTGTQTTTVGNNTISYQITYNNVTSGGGGCNYPTSGTVTVQQMAVTGAPIGQPVTITYTNQCGVVQVNTGSNTFTANLQNFNAPNPCQGAPRI